MAGTLSTTELLADVLDAFKVKCPVLLKGFSTDFSNREFKLNQTISARIRSLPSVQSYDSSTGYKANAASANALLTEVPVTLSQHKHVPIKIDYIDQISTRRNLYQETIADMAYVLGKSVVDYALGLVVAANVTEETTESIANTNKDTLDAVKLAMTGKGALPTGRCGLVNSAFFDKLDQDSEITSGDYHGQRVEANAYGHLQNIAGFQDIWEYPDLPANSENMSAFFFDPRCVAVATGIPQNLSAIAQEMGIREIATTEVVTDPDTGLTLMGIKWQDPGTMDLYMTTTLFYGAAVGAQGGSAGDLTDYAGHRVVTA